MIIRIEKEKDRDAVFSINESAFETPSEAILVDTLREQAQPFVSLVAERAGKIVGQIFFSPVSLAGSPDLKIMGLAPMAVAPEQRHKGIGSSLVRSGLEQCKKLGFTAVVVLGHPEYYPRFGFSPVSSFGIDCEYKVPAGVFMAIELQPGALSGKTGRVKYHSAFKNL
jgi:putative acetyltransferase